MDVRTWWRDWSNCSCFHREKEITERTIFSLVMDSVPNRYGDRKNTGSFGTHLGIWPSGRSTHVPTRAASPGSGRSRQLYDDACHPPKTAQVTKQGSF